MLSRIKEKSDAPGITLLAKPRIGRSGRTTAKSNSMIPLYSHFVNVQTRRRRCTISSDGTVQSSATKVFNSQRPRCSTPPPYSMMIHIEKKY